jgi:RNA polymerase sigma-70 factor (ECF subfamily)
VSKEVENLVRSAIAGDLDSFGELAKRYYAAMVSIAYAVGRDHHAAEDAAQEALGRAMVSLGRLRRPERFGPWLCQICRNVAYDMLSGKAEAVSDPGLVASEPCERDDRLSQAVNEALTRLPKASRELVVLKYYNDLSYEQISEAMGLSKAAINGRLTRAKRKLADYLRRNGVAEMQS